MALLENVKTNSKPAISMLGSRHNIFIFVFIIQKGV
tara:strand:- start:1363 stop:1470 length:108 start_codon:yes stop_codon:yes gene_type:complete